MIEDVLLLDGAERPQPDVQEHLGDLHALFTDAPQKLRREMQPRGGRGGRAVLPRIDRLIALGICQLFMDIGRERHRPDARKDVLKRSLVRKFYDTFPRIGDREHLQGKFLVDDEPYARTALFAGTHEHLPGIEGEALQQQHLDRAAVQRMRIQPRGQHARAVDDEHVPRL